MAPFFTIITATYNAEKVIGRLLDSLIAQSSQDYELLVPDGASTDNTVEILETLQHRLPSLTVSSDPDNGVYDAWEKILPYAQGEWVLFLGADDTLADASVLERAKEKLMQAPNHVQFGLGNLTYIAQDGKPQYSMLMIPEGSRALLPTRNPMGHAAIFHRRSFLKEHHFDTSFRVVGDYDFFCKYWRDELGIALNLLVAYVAIGGISSNPDWARRTRGECLRIRRRYFPSVHYRMMRKELPFLLWDSFSVLCKKTPLLGSLYIRMRQLRNKR